MRYFGRDKVLCQQRLCELREYRSALVQALCILELVKELAYVATAYALGTN